MNKPRSSIANCMVILLGTVMLHGQAWADGYSRDDNKKDVAMANKGAIAVGARGAPPPSEILAFSTQTNWQTNSWQTIAPICRQLAVMSTPESDKVLAGINEIILGKPNKWPCQVVVSLMWVSGRGGTRMLNAIDRCSQYNFEDRPKEEQEDLISMRVAAKKGLTVNVKMQMLALRDIFGVASASTNSDELLLLHSIGRLIDNNVSIGSDLKYNPDERPVLQFDVGDTQFGFRWASRVQGEPEDEAYILMARKEFEYALCYRMRQTELVELVKQAERLIELRVGCWKSLKITQMGPGEGSKDQAPK